jgi:hypothetical protein
MQTDDPTAPTASPGGMRSGYGRIAALVVGDLIAFVVFATLGRDTHHEATGLGAIGETLWTALPFRGSAHSGALELSVRSICCSAPRSRGWPPGR